MRVYRAEIWCDGPGPGKRCERGPDGVSAGYRESTPHDDVACLPGLCKNLEEIYEREGWVIQGGKHICPECAVERGLTVHPKRRESGGMKLIREWLDSSLRCKRLGHTPTTARRVIRRPSLDYGCVAHDFQADFDVCTRCGQILSKPRNEKQIDWWSSITMPSEMDRAMRRDGYVVLR